MIGDLRIQVFHGSGVPEQLPWVLRTMPTSHAEPHVCSAQPQACRATRPKLVRTDVGGEVLNVVLNDVAVLTDISSITDPSGSFERIAFVLRAQACFALVGLP